MAIKFNIEPYWDDYNTPGQNGLTPKEQYNKILFRPSHAVQARELTQMQSMLQNQVSSMGDHMFKEGSVVIPGGVSIYNKIDYLKLSAVNTTNMNDLIGIEFTSGSNTAKVVHAEAATDTDPVTLFVNYTSGDKFANNTSLTGPTSLTATVASSGYGSLVSVDDGIYYIKKHFVIVKKATIVLSKYTTDISYDVGLKVTERIVTSGEDDALADNAAGSPNVTAPGAHRYSITTTLSKQINNGNIGNFVLLARLESGIIAKHARASDYAVLEDTLARRTFDESGNYTVNPFPAQIKPNVNGDDTKLTIGIEPSKAYVRGYEIQTLNTTNVDLDKARDSDLATDTVTEITHNNYIDVSGMTDLPEIENFNTVDLLNSADTSTGTVRIRSIQSLAAAGNYRLHVFDLTGTITDAVSVAAISTTSSFNATTIIASNLASDSLIYPLPYTRIKTCSAETNPGSPPDYNYRFEANKVFRGSVATNIGGDVQAIFNIDLGNEVFGPKELNTNWILVNNDAADAVISFSLDDLIISAGGLTATIENLSTTYNGDRFSLVAPVVVTKTHKDKTLVIDQMTVLPTSAFTGSTPAPLQHCDVLRINSIMEGSNDVTEHFDFNNGQTDTHYDRGTIQLKANTNYTVNADLTVKYDYFDHSVGDFFTVDSYSIEYSDIPSHNGIELRSAVDFRPRMKNAGNGFDGDGAVFASCPRPNSQFETDIQYYLNRIDKVYLDKDGEFGVLNGVSDLNPKEPGVPKDAMVLYHLFIPAYTLTPDEVSIKFIENRRYTMRDIGKLDRRIGNLEYYTTLSLLEKEADNKQILSTDAATLGLSRTKSGFLVDSFTSTNIARATSNEFRAGIDRRTGTLRPLFNEGNIGLEYDSTSTTQRTGDLVTLPYTTKTIISQVQSSGTINVNPFNVFNWTGTLNLTPSSDEWKDTERRPQLIVNNDGVFDALRDIADATVATGTVWNSWQTNWSGSTSSSSTSTSTSDSWWFRSTTQTTNTTTTTNTGQSRSGVNTTIGTDTVETNIGDRVVEVNFAPFMRSRIVNFTGTRMRPNTQVFPFFDGVDISQWVNQVDLVAAPTLVQQQYAGFGLVGSNWFTSHPGGNTTLTTDANGAITGTFFVPNNESLNFKTGDKTLLLTDSSVNNEENTGTFASATYSAKGLIETKENVVISTRVPTIQRTNVSDSRIITSTSKSSVSSKTTIRLRWADPLAQSILLNIDGGAFITSLELFFSTKDSNIPVQVQFRKMDQGIPTQEVIPFSDVTINASDVNVDGTSTTFTFESPVYLQDGIEYCFVIMANSNEYKVKYAEIGGEDEAGNRISKQPYNGVMFKSQNASTWTPDQNKDLTFKLNRAVFDTTTPASLVLKNSLLPTRSLTNDPFQTLNASPNIIVTHRNHGMLDGDSVTIDVEEAISSINGIPLAEVKDTHTISSVERDKYTITTSSNASGTGIDGNDTVTATQNLAFNTIYPLIQEITLPNTGMIWGIKDSTEKTGSLGSSYLPVIINENYTPSMAKVIKQGSTSSLYLNGIFASDKDNISPVVDMDRCSAITISNRIDKPSATAIAGYNVVADYAPETDAGNGSVLSKYITKTVKLDETSDQIKVYLDINRPSFTDVHLYHKTGSESITFDSESWVAIDPESGTVPYSDSGEFSEMEYTIDVSNFTMFAIKIVFTSQTTAKVPSAQNLRAIALQS